MQIVLIVLFAALLSPGLLMERAIYKPLTALVPTLAAVGTFTLLVPLVVGLVSRAGLQRLRQPGRFAHAANLFGHANTVMRIGVLAMFAALVTQTGWLNVVHQTWKPFGWQIGRTPLLGDLVILGPVLISIVLCWLVMYPTDRALRRAAMAGLPEELTGQPIWRLGQYMDFQVRNQLLTVLVPMGLFIIAADLMNLYRDRLTRATNLVWAPEGLLALIAATVFVMSPVMLRYVWRTQRLPASPLRARLEETCRRLGLGYRDILIWRSHGAMVNAAVMGILPHIRYVLLSDGLLDHLSQEQVEAVFGHEAGHVKERHIAYYMVFAIASMMGVSLTGDWLMREAKLSPDTVEVIVAGMVAFIWFVVFGWISRRFERQADLYGVRCLDGSAEQCQMPCWQHNITPEPRMGERLCTTGAHIFASALEAVASLNGINKYARSWRHSSIASRQEFVRQTAIDPQTLRHFEKVIRRIKIALVVVTLALAALGAWVYSPILFPKPARHRPRPVQPTGSPIWVMRGHAGESPAGQTTPRPSNASAGPASGPTNDTNRHRG